MQCISNPMTSSDLLKPSPETLFLLASRADQLTKPTDYYISGAGFFSGPLPENLICFARRTPRALWRAGIRFHHHRWVFITALKGEGRIYIDDKQVHLRPGEAVVIHPFQFHTYSDVDSELNWLFISFEMPDEMGRVHPQRTQKLDRIDVELLNECLRSWQEDGQEHLSPLYLGLLWNRLKARPELVEEVYAPTIESTLLLRVNQIIMERPHQPYCIKELAAVLGISESHLRARFREATGESIGKHMRELRIRHACRLLHSGNQTISEIAECCGFQNVFAFSRAFRGALSQSPSEYRRRFQESLP